MMESQDYNELRDRLFHDLAVSLSLWRQYERLFLASPDDVTRLNDHARWFFGIVQRVFLDQMVVSVSRLTDPARQRGRANASLRSLLEDPRLCDSSPFAAVCVERMKQVLKKARPIRRHRDRAVVHRDLRATFGQDQLPNFQLALLGEVLEDLAEIHRLYGVHVLEVDSDYEIRSPWGADMLLEALYLAPTRKERAGSMDLSTARQHEA